MRRISSYFRPSGPSLSRESSDSFNLIQESDEDVNDMVFALRQRESTNITASHYEKTERLGFNLTGLGPPQNKDINEIYDNFSPELKKAIIKSDRASINPINLTDSNNTDTAINTVNEHDEVDSLKSKIFESKGRTFIRRFSFADEDYSDADESSNSESIEPFKNRVKNFRKGNKNKATFGLNSFGHNIGIEVAEKILEEKRKFPNFIEHNMNVGILSFGKVLRPDAEPDYVNKWKWECSKKVKPLWKIPAAGSKGYVSTHKLLKKKFKEKSLALRDDDEYRLDEVHLVFAVDGELIKMEARSNFEGFRNKFGDSKPKRKFDPLYKREPRFRYVFDLAGYRDNEIVMKLYPGNRLLVKGIKSHDPITELPQLRHMEGIPIPGCWTMEGLYAWRTEMGLLVIEDADNIEKKEPTIPPINLDLDYLQPHTRGFKPLSVAKWGKFKKFKKKVLIKNTK